MADDVRISKSLAYWLRHRPDAAGLVLDPAGWAPIDQVLAAVRKDMPDADLDRLLRVVKANDKQRFEISNDAGFIRARQGHSLRVEGDWPVTAPPLFLFHGTVERVLPAILKQGLRPMQRHHVHLSPDRATAERVGARRGVPVVLKVQAARLAQQGGVFRLTSNGVWLIDHVPPAFFMRVV